MAITALRRLTFELNESYRRNRGDVQGLVFRHYPDFVLNARLNAIEDQVIVFAFHDVEPETFERQLRHLRENDYHVLKSADALLACLRGEQPIQPKSVLLTFDDGVESLYTVVFPLLKQYGFHAVSFIVPSFVGKVRFCTWEQLQEMHQSGTVDIQSHTFFHRFAPDWPRAVGCNGIQGGLAEADRYPTMSEEYRRAREVIEERLGKSVRHLCYPDYDGTKASVAASQAAGYVSNFWGVIPGRKTNRKGNDPFYIVRVLEDYLLCLPGQGRRSLWSVAVRRVKQNGRPAMKRLLGKPRPIPELVGCDR